MEYLGELLDPLPPLKATGGPVVSGKGQKTIGIPIAADPLNDEKAPSLNPEGTNRGRKHPYLISDVISLRQESRLCREQAQRPWQAEM